MDKNYRDKSVKIKNGVGFGLVTDDLSGKEFIIEDYAYKMFGNQQNALTVEYEKRTGKKANDRNILCGKVGELRHLFHVDEFVDELEV